MIELERFRAMLAGAPALPLIVTGEGRVRAHERVADWFGLSAVPRKLPDLLAALDPADAEGLESDILATSRGGGAFARALRPAGGRRVLMVRGRPGGDPLGEGAALLWVFDATDSEEEIARLDQERVELAETLDALAGLIEAAPIPMWHRAPDLRLSLVNSAYVRAVDGADAADVIGRGLELVEGQGAQSPLATAAAARDEGAVSVRTVPATIGGERRTLRVVDVPLGPIGIAGYAMDIEEVEQARADLVRFTEAQRDMLDRLSAGVAQFSADRHLTFVNTAFQRLFAMLPEWLADRPEFDRVIERMREAGRLPESRDFPGWKAERRRWFLAEQPVEEAWQLPGGAHLRVVGQPLPDGGLLLIFEDRTEQVKLQSARDTLLRVRTATFNNLFEAIGVFAADGRLHLWNDRFREIWTLDEDYLAEHPRVDALIGRIAPALANPARAGLIRELVRLATAERQSRTGRIAFADGRHFRFAAVPLPDGNALFTLLDITDSRRAEQALRERAAALEEGDRVKSAFVAAMSYELRTPLTSIGGFAEMLSGGFAGPLGERAREYVGAILTATERLGELVDEVLDLTRSAAGRLELDVAPLDFAGLVREIVADHAELARHRGIDLTARIDRSSGTIDADAQRLRQAIGHVLANAVIYTQEGGRVLVRAEGAAGDAQVIVTDNGPGLTPSDVERAFHPFHRAGLEGQRSEGSLGLGLPLARHYVEAHGGTIRLDSAPGQGTTVAIALPRARGAEAP
ncbi:PAS-domain containing protein [Sphingomonas morindae]|uniref:histidine kinase n=1 Tax=Sphingomonas morindae TaxID=1541170 RepID=A0ABY4XCJ0_9SPHN|nr:sensor histidine kinase [Sphingomonas morindae]USI74613.1 PAS-domain containing protein [Sphingomonas morindae]